MTAVELQAAVARLLDERERQGLERTCSDPSVLALIAGLLGETPATKTKSSTAPTPVEPLEGVNGGTSTVDARLTA